MQGGAESSPLSWELFEHVRRMACDGAQQLFLLYDTHKKDDESVHQQPSERIPLFSLKSRQQSLL